MIGSYPELGREDYGEEVSTHAPELIAILS